MFVFLAQCRLKNSCAIPMFSLCMCTSLYVYIRERKRGVLPLSTFETMYLLSQNLILMLCNWRSSRHRTLWFSAVDTHSIANTHNSELKATLTSFNKASWMYYVAIVHEWPLYDQKGVNFYFIAQNCYYFQKRAPRVTLQMLISYCEWITYYICLYWKYTL